MCAVTDAAHSGPVRRSTVRDVRAAVSDAARRASSGVELERDVARHVARAVPFDLWCGLTLDPATLLPTGGYHAEGLPAQHMPRLLEIEHGPVRDAMMDLRVLAVAAIPARPCPRPPAATWRAASATATSSNPPGCATSCARSCAAPAAPGER